MRPVPVPVYSIPYDLSYAYRYLLYTRIIFFIIIFHDVVVYRICTVIPRAPYAYELYSLCILQYTTSST